jgi:hypothetical protein
MIAVTYRFLLGSAALFTCAMIDAPRGELEVLGCINQDEY